MELPNSPYSYFIVFGIGLTILEVVLGAATAFELLIIGIIFVIAGFTGMVADSLVVTMITAAVLCILYFIYGRSIVRNTFNITTKATNVDALMGEKGRVVKIITPSIAGQVKVNGEIWRATAEQVMEENQEVIIESVSGVTLSVTQSKS